MKECNASECATPVNRYSSSTKKQEWFNELTIRLNERYFCVRFAKLSANASFVHRHNDNSGKHKNKQMNKTEKNDYGLN